MLSPRQKIVVVGSSVAGFTATRALRDNGFDGAICLVGEESFAPYERPALSKGILTGVSSPQAITLPGADDLAASGVEWVGGRQVVSLNPQTKTVSDSDGGEWPYDKLIIATGARARELDTIPTLPNVHYLRHLQDAIELRAALHPGSHLVIIGGGFIGGEVASSARTLGVDVTLIEREDVLFGAAGDVEVSRRVADLHDRHQVRVELGRQVAGFQGTYDVQAVLLDDGRALPCDTVLVGVGTVPNTEWLNGSGLAMSDGILCAPNGSTSLPDVWAAGDIARIALPDGAHARRGEHWTAARTQGLAVAANVLGGCHPLAVLPYAWSDQHGIKIQVVGEIGLSDRNIEELDLVTGRWLSTYNRNGQPVGAIGFGAPVRIAQLRRSLETVAS